MRERIIECGGDGEKMSETWMRKTRKVPTKPWKPESVNWKMSEEK